MLFLPLLLAAAAADGSADGQCVEGGADDPTCSSAAATVEPAAGGGSCCESLVLCLQKKTFSQEQLAEPVNPPAAVDSPAPEGSPVSDALQTILQRDESEDARELAFLVSTGHCPAHDDAHDDIGPTRPRPGRHMESYTEYGALQAVKAGPVQDACSEHSLPI